ncbi:MAG: twin-arginine translocase TatA/TatE family subunit [Planctomycetota bacterium]
MFGLSPAELVIIGIVALVIFGNRLPEVARSLGKGVVEFRKGLRGIEEEIKTNDQKPAKPQELAHHSQEKVTAIPKMENQSISQDKGTPS